VACTGIATQASPHRVEPDRGRDVELARQCGITVAEGAGDCQRPLPSPLAHTVGKRADVGAVDGTHQAEDNGFGVCRSGEAEVQVEGEPALVAGIEFAQRGAALEHERVERTGFVQLPQ
jgi:hypothetical protein